MLVFLCFVLFGFLLVLFLLLFTGYAFYRMNKAYRELRAKEDSTQEMRRFLAVKGLRQINIHRQCCGAKFLNYSVSPIRVQVRHYKKGGPKPPDFHELVISILFFVVTLFLLVVSLINPSYYRVLLVIYCILAVIVVMKFFYGPILPGGFISKL